MLPLFLFFAVLETALRARQMRQGIPFFRSPTEFEDSEIGWSGKYFPGNLESANPKILFLGDSFTEAMQIDSKAAYFSIAANELGAEPFAYGGQGYGNLQELLILKRLLPEVKPRLIVLQLCVNDILNNSWELERRSYLQNALLPRPYLEDGQILLKFPRNYPDLRLFLETNSRLARYIFGKSELLLHELAQKKRIATIENEIVGKKGNVPLFQEAVNVTEAIFREILKTSGDIPVIAFLVDEIPPYHREFHRIAESQKLTLLPSIASAIMDQEKKRRVMRLADNVHWNGEGHAVAGKTLASEIKARFPEIFGETRNTLR